ncbi:MAG: hypothetical protein H7X95_02410, partial [Deltaproteobacteria bacterium]|nr:hypothetical protein [Deltaproteobacteria bacterium]
MTGRSVTVLLSVSLLWAFTGAACIGVSQKRAGSKSSGSSTVVNAPLGTAALAAAGIKTCPGGTRPAEDGDLDDFEDRDAQ